jgi:hypothetical protein
MSAFSRAIPADEFAGLADVEDLIGLISAEVADRDAIDPVLSRLMFEAMREAERDAALRERMSAMLTQYRELMIQAIRADQERGAVSPAPRPTRSPRCSARSATDCCCTPCSTPGSTSTPRSTRSAPC